MNRNKVTERTRKGNNELIGTYDHYIAIDWSMKVMVIATMNSRSKTPKVYERPSDIREVKEYLTLLKGRKVLALEETTTAHWLYQELIDYVDRIIICDPYRNRLLLDGPKTDKIDAAKLCMLLRAGLLKEVFHSGDKLYELRSLVSSYEDIVQAGVRTLNQQKALALGHSTESTHASFILDHIKRSIELYQASKHDYEKKFEALAKEQKLVKQQQTIPGIGNIGAVKIVATVVDARRFPHSGKYLSYCGLVYNEKWSGGRSYGRRRPRYNRRLKSVYKLAAMSCLCGGNNPMREYYDALLAAGCAEHNARNAVARYIARVSYGMLKNGQRFVPYATRME